MNFVISRLRRSRALSGFSLVFSFVAFSLNLAPNAAGQSSDSPSREFPTVSAAMRLSDAFSEVARQVERAVVSIDAKTRAADASAGGRSTTGESDDIRDFFRRQLPRRPVYSMGSGFIIDRAGHILTNAHVIDNTSKITVKLDSGEEYLASVVGTDDETDLAVLKINAQKSLPFLKLADSDRVRVGDWVLAVGSPFGLSRTVTAGIVSQVKRETPDGSPFQRFIQTDAAINRGNSGGPLVNLEGEVIGINSQIATSTGDYNGVGFALPSAEAASVIKQLIDNGRVRRGFLGVGLDSVKAEFAKVYGLGESRGAIITLVSDPKGAAASAGLRPGDVVFEFNGYPIVNAQDLIAKVAAASPEGMVSLSYYREIGNSLERKIASLKLGERPTRRAAMNFVDQGKPAADKPGDSSRPFGLTLVELTPKAAADYQVEGQSGLFVKEINPESFIAEVKNSAGGEALGEGDIIQRINRKTVTDAKSFAEAVNALKKGDAVVLHVVSVDPRTKVGRLKIVQFTVQ